MAIMSTYSALRGRAVTPSDSTILSCRALYVGGAGDVVVILHGDYDRNNPTSNTVTFADVPAGTVLAIACTKVMAATAATDIVALY